MGHEAAGAANEGTEESPPAGDFGISPSGYRLPASVRLGPVRLQVADLGRSEEFYRRVLGMVPHEGTSGPVALGAGGSEPLIELVERTDAAPVPPRGRLGLYHFALRVPSRAGLGRVAEHLRDLEVRIGTADHLVSEALYLSDPDGLGIEVYRDRPRDSWKTDGRQVVMTTEPLEVDGLIAAAASSDEAASLGALPPETVLGHVHLHVGDLEEASRFYHQALGFDKVVWSYPGALFFSAGGYHHHVGTNTWARGARPAASHDARLLAWTLVVPDDREVERVVQSVREAGRDVTEVGGEAGGRDRFRIEDPWNTAVEVVWTG